MSASEPTANEILWCLKRSWLEGDSVEQQRFVALAVADWLEEHWRPREACLLRAGRWMLWYDALSGQYLVKQAGECPDATHAWPIHWPEAIKKCDRFLPGRHQGDPGGGSGVSKATEGGVQ